MLSLFFGQGKGKQPDPVEIKMQRKTLMNAKNIRDIIKGIPVDCKIFVSFVTSSKKAGIINRGSFTGSEDIQKHLPLKDCEVIYMLLTSYCKDAHNPSIK